MNLTEKKYFIFDFDGTLVDSNSIKFNAYFEALNYDKNLVNQLKNIMQENENLDRFEVFEKISLYCNYIDVNKLSLAYGKICHDMIIKAPEIKGAEEFLIKLTYMHKIKIINSATPLSYLKNIVQCTNLNDLIDDIFGRPKTKEENLSLALKKYNISIKHAVIIGDSESDRVCAEKMNCDFIGFENEFSKYKNVPNNVITDYYDIINKI